MYPSIFLALTMATAVLAVPAPIVPVDEGVTVSLAHRAAANKNKGGAANMDSFLREMQNTLSKYRMSKDVPQAIGNLRNKTIEYESKNGKKGGKKNEKRLNTVAMSDQVQGGEDQLYYGPGQVGAAKQTFTFNFDTGSSDTFIPGPQCGVNQGCTGTTKYNQAGVNEGNTTTTNLGSGPVTGNNYFDTLTIAGLTATRHNVISITDGTGLQGSNSDSLLGMAFQSLADSGQPPFFQTLIAQKKVTTQEFSFYLGRDASNTAAASELTLAGRNTAKFTGAITQVPVTSQTYWQIALDQMTVNGKAVASSKGQAAIDTGTTIVLAPTAATTALFNQIPLSFPIPLLSGSADVTMYAYPCNYNGVVALQFAGKAFKINALDFNYGQITEAVVQQLGLDTVTVSTAFRMAAVQGPVCLASVAAADVDPTQNLYVVGDTFLKNWYSIFSFNGYQGKPSVSFAAAVKNYG